MASIYALKPPFQALLRPLVRWLAGMGIRANAVTVLACALSLLVGLAILLWPQGGWPLIILPVVLVIRMAMNAVDGMLAREHNQKSTLGGLLNELGDVISDAALYLPLAFVGLNPAMIVLIVVLGIIGEMTGVLGQVLGSDRRYDGPLGKSDRALVFGAMALWIGLGGSLDLWADWVLAVLIVLSLLTVFNRARGALAKG